MVTNAVSPLSQEKHNFMLIFRARGSIPFISIIFSFRVSNSIHGTHLCIFFFFSPSWNILDHKVQSSKDHYFPECFQQLGQPTFPSVMVPSQVGHLLQFLVLTIKKKILRDTYNQLCLQCSSLSYYFHVHYIFK